ncbi:MAG TPA: hypothetical protein VG621_02220 [Candidatus Paceibacterota bacterium]|nr:hypothetical protein [Candidatus Paceibacterota bacterium]
MDKEGTKNIKVIIFDFFGVISSKVVIVWIEQNFPPDKVIDKRLKAC